MHIHLKPFMMLITEPCHTLREKGKPGKERAKSKYTQQLQFPLQQLDKNFAKKTICMETLGRTKLKQTRNKNFPDSQTRRVEIRSACACAWPDKSFN